MNNSIKNRDCAGLFAAIDSLSDEYIGHWAEFTSIESPTQYKEGVDRAVDYICSLARERGWTVEKKKFERAGDFACITMNQDAPGRPVAVSGHADTVHPVGSFGSEPVRIEGDVIYGPGVNDCKGGIVACVLAMDALKRIGFNERPVILLVQTDEETSNEESGLGTIRYMCGKAREAEAFLNCEPFRDGRVTLRRKGIAEYEFTVKGRGAHAANCYNGVSAVAEAAMKILELERFKDREGITCSCGMISGGKAWNSVPETCTFTADFRFCDASQLETVRKTAERVAGTAYIEGSECTLRLAALRSAMPLTEANRQLLDRINAIYESCGMPVLEPSFNFGGSDAAYVTEAGIPCVDSLGTHGFDIHTVKERADVHSLAESAKRIASVIYCL